jgi:HD-GYP domain-containing protein (c-di-GMP phosphodiesterase class II)
VDADDAATLITASRRCQIAVGDLRLGMFVAELDRPWLDTPFLLQGFLVDSQVELDTLRKYCAYVYVDLELSSASVADEIRRAEVTDPVPVANRPDFRSLRATPAAQPAPAPGAPAAGPAAAQAAAGRAAARPGRPGAERVYKARADLKISTDTRHRFRSLVKATAQPGAAGRPADGSVVSRAMAWLRDRVGAGAGAGAGARRLPAPRAARESRDALRAWLPTGIDLTEYQDARPLEQELPRARGAFGRGEDVLGALVTDLKVGRIPQMAEVASAVDDMVDSMVDNPDALLWVGRLREEDVTTYNHGVKVALYLIALGRQIGFPKKELSHLGLIGMLADVGKIKLPRALLEKPGMLSPSEFGLIKEHVRLGLEALGESGALPREVGLGIAQHHERLDGSGYPKGLKRDEISIYGRMAAIADSFAALITPRAYANAAAPQDALMNLYEWAGTSFHEPLVEQFVQAVGVFPVGSLVELSSGEVAVVVAHNRVRRLEPRVLVLTWPDKSPLAKPVERDLLAQPRTGSSSGRLRIVRGLASGAYGLKLQDYYLDAGRIAQADDGPA